MPAVNLYWATEKISQEQIILLKQYIAELLSCHDRVLDSSEISIRVINTSVQHMIADIECDIYAYNYPERIEKQDEICNKIREYLLQHTQWLTDARVWLILSELWHSF